MLGGQAMNGMVVAMALAKVLGLYFVVLSLGVIVNADRQRKIVKEMVKSPAAVFSIGCIALLMGLVIVTLHNRWLPNWTLLITIIGWSKIVKGSLMLIFPEEMARFAKHSIKDNTQVIGAILALVLGLYLTLMGFTIYETTTSSTKEKA